MTGQNEDNTSWEAMLRPDISTRSEAVSGPQLTYDDVVRAYRLMDTAPRVHFTISDETRRLMADAFEVPEELLRNAGHQRFIDAYPPGDIAFEFRLDSASSRNLARMMGVTEAVYDQMVSDVAEQAEQPPADLVDRIQQVIDEASPFDGKCMRCGSTLDPNGPSPLYCHEQCGIGHAERRTDEGFRQHWAPDDARIEAERGSPLHERRMREHTQVARVGDFGRASGVREQVARVGDFGQRFRNVLFDQLSRCGETYLVLTPNGGVLLWDIERPPAARELMRGCTVLALAQVPSLMIAHHVGTWLHRQVSRRSGNDRWHSDLATVCGCAVCVTDLAALDWAHAARIAPRWAVGPAPQGGTQQ